MRCRLVIVAALAAATACSSPQPAPAPVPPPVEPSTAPPTPVEPAPADAAATPTVPAPVPADAAAPAAPPDAAPPPKTAAGCHADATHCCMPDGRLVRPGGCQPSYPPHVQPATRRKADGTCEKIPCYLRCLPATARIATPNGDVPVSRLHVGDSVFTVDAAGHRIAAPILRMNTVPTGDSHTIVRVTLDDGRVVLASPGHPTADGILLGTLTRGATVDGATVVSARRVPYAGDHTWDLLPAGPTGRYWADGVLLGSTLHR